MMLRACYLILCVNLLSCSNQTFSSESGSAAIGSRKPIDGKNGNIDGPTEVDTEHKEGLDTDDAGTVELVEADLLIDRLPDSAAWQNCLFAHIVGQPEIELGCNRNAPKSNNRPPLAKNVKMKLKTNTCNQLRVYFRSNSGKGLKDNVSTEDPGRISSGATKQGTGINGPGINIIKEPGGSFLLEANDNGDADWHDVYLRITPPAGRSNIKFTVENSGIPCI